MPPLSIPRRYRTGLASVNELTGEDVALLGEALDTSPLEVSFETLAEPIQDRISTDIKMSRLLEAVASLNTLLPEDGAGAEQLAEDVAASEDLDLPVARQAAYAAMLSKLMRTPALIITAHASEVAGQHDKVFHDVRILTDIRPVFEKDPSIGVKMAAITATINMEYHPGGRGSIESFGVALDRGDLEYLGQVVERALSKMDALAELMKENDVPRWTPNFHHHGAS